MADTGQKVVIAMSGGVDSSVAAALLVQQGYDVTGMMLRLWSEEGTTGDNRCCTPDAMAQARRIAALIGIPFYALDARELFRHEVVDPFIREYVRGVTPNPCLLCNRKVRWGFLLDHARAMGADFLATGHYARIRRIADGSVELLKGLDEHKDQSYVLSVLNQNQLQHTLYPLGEMTKPEVRQLARDLNLPVAERPESQDLCFLADGDYRRFLRDQAPGQIMPGPIVNTQGMVLGEHQGLANYTIGQRKGLGVPSLTPLYVIGKDLATNTLRVGEVTDLGGRLLIANQVNWVSGQTPAAPLSMTVKIRYKAVELPAWIYPLEGERARVALDSPARDITPGQRAVFYQGEVCLGGGTIE